MRSCIHCCSGKAMSKTYSEPVCVALGTQRAKRVRRIILPSLACPAVPYFTIQSHKSSEKLLNVKCVF
jgi:hypothetical protein